MTPTYIVMMAICANISVCHYLQKHLFQVGLTVFCLLLSNSEGDVGTAEEGTAIMGSPRQRLLCLCSWSWAQWLVLTNIGDQNRQKTGLYLYQVSTVILQLE